MITEGYNNFVRFMWQDNCIERESYKEPQLSYEQYARDNHSFLEEKFYADFAAKWVWDEELLDYREGQKNNFCMSASFFYFFNQLKSTNLSKNLPFTDLKKCDKIYPKLIDTKINYNSSQLNASEGHSDIYAIGVQSELREIASPNP